LGFCFEWFHPDWKIEEGIVIDIRKAAWGLALAFSAAAAFSGPAVSDGINYASIHKVTGVNDAGIILLEDHEPIRLWGMIAEGPYLCELIVGEQLTCTFADVFKPRVSVGRCTLGGFTDYVDPEKKDLHRYLINQGHAVEFCAESLNYYKTCPETMFSLEK
jgi:hypothetical protein